MTKKSTEKKSKPKEFFTAGKTKTYNIIQSDLDREVIEAPNGVVIRNKGIYNRRIVVGTPTLGSVRIEWVASRKGQAIPINWQGGDIIAPYFHNSVAAVGYQIADAQNVIAERVILDKYEWLLLVEDDVIAPFDAMLRLDEHITRGDTPIISGFYYTKSDPSWPLIFRGRGNGCFLDFKFGDQLWVDGVCTGFVLIHSSIIKYFWENSPKYKLPDGRTVSQVFEFPRKAWIDPETNNYFSELGTSDLHFCNRIIKEDVLRKTGWSKVAGHKYPFLVDTRIFCHQIDPYGRLYPQSASRILGPNIFEPSKVKQVKKVKK